ncbi:MAG TPA: type II toxin-antitoxin system RelB/DinJ family antitoxin [Candidatus Paceibacterota bacterium]
MDTKVNFRTNKKILARADKVFKSMGMDRSTALNIFLARVEAEEGLPFKPTANHKMLRAKWDKEVAAAKKTRGYKTAEEAMRAALR